MLKERLAPPLIRHLKKIFMSEEFGAVMDLVNEIVGSHSIQKFALTHTRRSGCSRDNLNAKVPKIYIYQTHSSWSNFSTSESAWRDSGIMTRCPSKLRTSMMSSQRNFMGTTSCSFSTNQVVMEK